MRIRTTLLSAILLALTASTASAQPCDPYYFFIQRVEPAFHLARRSIALRVIFGNNCSYCGGCVASNPRLRLQVAGGGSTDFRTVPHTVHRHLVRWRVPGPGTYRLRFEFPRSERGTPVQPWRTEPVVVRVLDPDRPGDRRVPVRLRLDAPDGISTRVETVWPASPVLDADPFLRWATGGSRPRPRRRPSANVSLAPGRYVVRTADDYGRGAWACFDVTGPGDVTIHLGGRTVRIDGPTAGANILQLVSECGYRRTLHQDDDRPVEFHGVPPGRALLIGYDEEPFVRTTRVFVREITVAPQNF